MLDDGLPALSSYSLGTDESVTAGEEGTGPANSDGFAAITDSALAAKARAGDREALGAMFRRHHRRIFQVAFGIMHDVAEAEDVVQETFIRVCEIFRSFKGDCAFSTWTHRIAVNLSLDAMRRLKRRKQHTPSECTCDEPVSEDIRDDDDRDAQSELLRTELASEISRAVDDLGETHRTIFFLREIDGLSYEELSAVLRVPKGTVMSRLFHARRKMQVALSPYVNADA